MEAAEELSRVSEEVGFSNTRPGYQPRSKSPLHDEPSHPYVEISLWCTS